MREIRKIAVNIFLLLLAAICLLPFFIMFNNATQSSADLAIRLTLTPGKSLLTNYQNMVVQIPFWTYIKNSLLATLPNVLLTAYFGTMAAYGFEKFEFRGKRLLFTVSMLMMVIPSQISLIGLYRMFSAMNLLNTKWTLILPGICNVLTVYWMRANIYQIIDTSLLEAATIDGCGQLGIFHKVVLPLCRTGVVTISIINFVAVWNDYINPVTFITTNKKTTLSVGIAMLNNFDYVDLGAVYVAIALSTIVILVFYILFNSQIMGGMTEGSVKG
ncbi:carbohydrate ABC transporter permease [Lachnospiraceae bacterium 54-53]